MRCTHTIDKNTSLWSKGAIQEVGQGHEDRACNTNDLQTLVYFTGSYAQLPSKSPVFPLGVIAPGWLGDRCQVAPPQLIHHAKQSRKAHLSLFTFFILFCLSASFLLPAMPTFSSPQCVQTQFTWFYSISTLICFPSFVNCTNRLFVWRKWSSSLEKVMNILFLLVKILVFH